MTEYYEEGTSYVTPKVDDRDVLEYLLKVLSKRFVEVEVADNPVYDCIYDSYAHFVNNEMPEDIQSFLGLEGRINNPEFMGRLIHLAQHIRYTKFFKHIASHNEITQTILWHLEDIRTEFLFLKERSLDTLSVKTYWSNRLNKIIPSDPNQLDLSLIYAIIKGRTISGVFSSEEENKLMNRFIMPYIDKDDLEFYDTLLEQYIQINSNSDGTEAAVVALKWLDHTENPFINSSLTLRCMDGEDFTSGLSGKTPTLKVESEVSEEESTNEELNPSQNQETEGEEKESDESENTSSEATNTSSEDQANPKDSEELQEELDSILDIPKLEDNTETFVPKQFNKNEYEKKKELNDLRDSTKNAANNVFPKEPLKTQTRPPKSEDFTLASKLAITFRKARWREPNKIILKSKIPPGKLNSREAVTMAAQRQMGIPTTAEPFRQIVKKKAEGPPPIVGMACDISGSMSFSEVPMAQLAWACSRAIPKAGGKFAAVSFGRSVKSLIPPGVQPKMVPVLSARDTHEKAFEAISALTGGLNFLGRGEGVKILLISSDGIWSSAQVEKTLKLLKQLEKNGVHIFWIPFQKDVSKSAYYDEEVQIPILQIGSVLTFDKTSNIPMELAKLIVTEISKG